MSELTQEATEDGVVNSELEDSADLQEFVTQATEKVELDTDDALFLVEEEPEPEPEPLPVSSDAQSGAALAVQSSEPEDAEEKPKPLPKWFFALVAVLFLSATAFSVWHVYFSPLPELPFVKPLINIIVVPKAPMLERPEEEFIINLAPFIIEQRNAEQVHFLDVRFAVVLESQNAKDNTLQKISQLRDAIYYYLTNQDAQFFLNSDNIPLVKENVEIITKSYLDGGVLKALLVEQYLIK